MENASVYRSKYDGTNKLSGIIKKLRDNEKNVEDFISVSSSSVYQIYKPSYTLYENNLPFTSDDTNPYITYYFKERKLYLESYTILSVIDPGLWTNFPVHWTIKGSDDNATWRTLDVRHTEVFTERNQKEIFRCRRPQAFHYIKMSQIGLNSLNATYLRFEQIEFFGTLFPKEFNFFPNNSFYATCKKKQKSPAIALCLVMIIIMRS